MKRKILIFACIFAFFSKSALAENLTTLSLSPSSSQKQVGSTFALEIKINTGEKILGADIDLAYNPEILEVVKITPADFFANPQVLTNLIDQKEGLINLSIFSFPPQLGTATIATLTLKAIKEATQSTQIKFQSSTTLATIGAKEILFQTIPASIQILPVKTQITFPSPPSSPPQSLLPSPFATPTPTPQPAKPSIFLNLAKTFGTLLIIGGGILFLLVLVIL